MSIQTTILPQTVVKSFEEMTDEQVQAAIEKIKQYLNGKNFMMIEQKYCIK
jgi:hypothetical protein